MVNYNESTVGGAKWTRSNRVVGNNPIEGAKSIEFYEEDVFAAADGTTLSQQRPGKLTSVLSDPAAEFTVYGPDGVTVLGTATKGYVYILLASLYLAEASARDAAINATYEQLPPPPESATEAPLPEPDPTPAPVPDPAEGE